MPHPSNRLFRWNLSSPLVLILKSKKSHRFQVLEPRDRQFSFRVLTAASFRHGGRGGFAHCYTLIGAYVMGRDRSSFHFPFGSCTTTSANDALPRQWMGLCFCRLHFQLPIDNSFKICRHLRVGIRSVRLYPFWIPNRFGTSIRSVLKDAKNR